MTEASRDSNLQARNVIERTCVVPREWATRLAFRLTDDEIIKVNTHSADSMAVRSLINATFFADGNRKPEEEPPQVQAPKPAEAATGGDADDEIDVDDLDDTAVE